MRDHSPTYGFIGSCACMPTRWSTASTGEIERRASSIWRSERGAVQRSVTQLLHRHGPLSTGCGRYAAMHAVRSPLPPRSRDARSRAGATACPFRPRPLRRRDGRTSVRTLAARLPEVVGRRRRRGRPRVLHERFRLPVGLPHDRRRRGGRPPRRDRGRRPRRTDRRVSAPPSRGRDPGVRGARPDRRTLLERARLARRAGRGARRGVHRHAARAHPGRREGVGPVPRRPVGGVGPRRGPFHVGGRCPCAAEPDPRTDAAGGQGDRPSRDHERFLPRDRRRPRRDRVRRDDRGRMDRAGHRHVDGLVDGPGDHPVPVRVVRVGPRPAGGHEPRGLLRHPLAGRRRALHDPRRERPDPAGHGRTSPRGNRHPRDPARVRSRACRRLVRSPVHGGQRRRRRRSPDRSPCRSTC